MFKKFFITVVFIGLFAALVFGGINRTMAKSDNEPVNYERANQVEEHEVGEPQGRGQGRGNSQTDVESFERKGLADTLNEDTEIHEGNPYNGQGRSEALGQGGRGNSQTDVESFERKGLADTLSEDTEIHEGNLYNGQGRSEARGQGGRGFGGGSQEPLSEADIEALNMALDDEYHALSTYQAVMATFGEVEPFASIAQSEQRHIDALANQFNKYGIPVPENPYSDDPVTFESLEQA